MKNKLKRMRKNDGASFTIEFLFIIILLVFLSMAMIDMGLYMGSHAEIQNMTQDAARTAAIHGGNNSPITKSKYGGRKPSDQLEENLKNRFGKNKMIDITHVSCSPTAVKAGSPSKTVSCQVDYTYKRIAPDAFAMTPSKQSVILTSESEVWW